MAQTDQKLEQLKQKYQPALDVLQQQQIQLLNLHLQDNKLFVKGIAASEQAKNKVWDQIKLIDPSYSDLTCDITVDTSRQAAAAAGAQAASTGGQSYTVKPGDTLSKIAQQFYGNATDYRRIFEANRDKLSDPNKIDVGQKLTIPV